MSRPLRTNARQVAATLEWVTDVLPADDPGYKLAQDLADVISRAIDATDEQPTEPAPLPTVGSLRQ